MGDPKMEGVEQRLRDTHGPIAPLSSEKGRRASSIADTEGIEVVATPPKDLIKKLDGSYPGALCDQKMQVVWPSGPWKGRPLTGYCDEPLCITEGVCTGTRFVPHIDQWTTTEVTLRTRRTPTPAEIVKGVRAFARRAAMQTGRDEDRDDAEILRHVRQNWDKTIRQIRGRGEWRQSK